jgi:hypothetical protein
MFVSTKLLAWVKHAKDGMRVLENHFQDVMMVLSVGIMDLIQYQEWKALVNQLYQKVLTSHATLIQSARMDLCARSIMI